MKKPSIKILLSVAAFIIVCGFIDLANLDNYSAQGKPSYIVKDNTPLNNPVTNKGATLGRILFYDKNLSANRTISCANCHLQKFAFGDTATQSRGFAGGLTGRHAMRLVNARFSTERKFFWDERAANLEFQTTQPIQNIVEMGYSGTNGQNGIDSMIARLRNISYYKSLFPFVFGDSLITESRIQLALAQFVRSIQSFDSKFDDGLSQTNNLNAGFPNYSALENQGKALYLAPPPAGGAGCQGCHRAPEFDIDPVTNNNGIITVAGLPQSVDLTNTKAPSLRNLFDAAGQLNGPLMHDGSKKTIAAVIDHYNNCPQTPVNTNLDPRLQGPGGTLNLSPQQKAALVAFLKTLSGTAVYSDPKWSDPFDGTGNLSISTGANEIAIATPPRLKLFPNPVSDMLQVEVDNGNYLLSILDGSGRSYLSTEVNEDLQLATTELKTGVYYVVLRDLKSGLREVQKLVKE